MAATTGAGSSSQVAPMDPAEQVVEGEKEDNFSAAASREIEVGEDVVHTTQPDTVLRESTDCDAEQSSLGMNKTEVAAEESSNCLEEKKAQCGSDDPVTEAANPEAPITVAPPEVKVAAKESEVCLNSEVALGATETLVAEARECLVIPHANIPESSSPTVRDSGKKTESKKKETSHSGSSKSKKKEDKAIAPSEKGDESRPSKAEPLSPGQQRVKGGTHKEHILRALSSLSSTEEKLAALCKKYADLHEDHRVIQASGKQMQRKLTVITRQKDQLQLENTKAVMAKSQLENLCRELQKHNRIIKEESLARAREEDEKRKEISSRFQTTIGEIQAQMLDNHERNMKLREENAELATKLKSFLEQYEQREKYYEKMAKHRELEQQLSDAKLKQASILLEEERERNKKEREVLSHHNTEAEKKITLLEIQLQTYKDRYGEFQSTINRSNEMFSKLKSEMDKMTGKIKKLEKDGAQWKKKWQNCNRALLDMVEEKGRNEKEKLVLRTKIERLESLCRAQQEQIRGQKSPQVPETGKLKKEDRAEETTSPSQLSPPPDGAATDSSLPQADARCSSSKSSPQNCKVSGENSARSLSGEQVAESQLLTPAH